MKSIIQNDWGRCYLCGRIWNLECHHVFGSAFRSKSGRYGLTVHLCHGCHNEPPNGVHQNYDRRRWLQDHAQRIAMAHYGWSEGEFRAMFGRSYLMEEDNG